MSSQQAVVVRDLEKVFSRRKGLIHRRRRAALKAVSFGMERGECVAILGQNGSGKSTLVRLLSTLLLPDGGSAEVFGLDVVRDARAVQRLVNRVSVEASFFKKMSSAENLAYAARFYGLTRRETRTRILPRSWRYAPISRVVVARLTSIEPPVALTPLAM